MTSPCPSFTGNPRCPRCHQTHGGNCVQGRQCFSCGEMGHMRKEGPILQGYPSAGLGTERWAGGIVPFLRLLGTFRRPFNTPRSAMTQSSVQQPRARGRMNALTQQETQISNTMVEDTISLMGHIAWVLFDPSATLFCLISICIHTKHEIWTI